MPLLQSIAVSRAISSDELFVVGGPVPSDWPYYVQRSADRLIETTLRSRRFCYVLAPHGTGKTSLMFRAIRALRRTGQRGVAVDLGDLDAHHESTTGHLWAFGIAQRIAAGLELDVDLARWWQTKTSRGAQRFVDFFSDVVLANTTALVTIFIDEIERTVDRPFAQELYAAIRACDARRTAEPDYARLSFVVLGVATPRMLCPEERISPFLDGRAIELADFDTQESYDLAPALGGDPALAQALMDRICRWTNGQPYLTQKVARGVARKGGKLEDVEQVVEAELMSAGAADPLLERMRAMLGARTRAARNARGVLRRIARGGAWPLARTSEDTRTLLHLSGAASLDRERGIRYRNRIFHEALGKRWLKVRGPGRLAVALAAALLLAALVAGGYWYREYVPRPYVDTLTDVAASVADWENAYRRLRDLPGFAARADELFAAALGRESRNAQELAAAERADRALRGVLGRAAAADTLMAEFWLRRAAAAMHAERRDDALLYAREALPAPRARALVAELVDSDYALLERSIEWRERPAAVTVDWTARRLVGLSGTREVRALALDERGVVPPHEPFSVLEYRPLERYLGVEDGGSAGVFTLTLELEHAAAEELFVTLVAPNGASAGVALDAGGGALRRRLVAQPGSPLFTLADEDRRGVWRLAIVDRRTPASGTLQRWSLAFDGDAPWVDEIDGGAAIPDPERSTHVRVQLAGHGGVALVRPNRAGTSAALALWSLRDGRLLRDVELPGIAASVALDPAATRLAAVAGNVLHLFRLDGDGTAAEATVATQTRFVLPPALSDDGEYLMIAEEVEGAPPLFSLLRAADGAFLTSVEGVLGVRDWQLGHQARYLLLEGEGTPLAVMDPRRGGAPQPLAHVRPIERVVPLAGDGGLVTVDGDGDVRSWMLGGEAGPVPTLLGTTSDPASVTAAAARARIAFAAPGALVDVYDAVSGARLQRLRVAPGAANRAHLSPDGSTLVTLSGADVRVWRLATPDGVPAAPAAGLPALSAFALDADGRTAALGWRSGQARLAPIGVPLAADALDYFGHRGAIGSVALRAERELAATGGLADGTIRLWNTTTGEPGRALAQPGGPLGALALGARGERLASAAGAQVRVWRIAAVDQAAAIATAAAPVSALALDAAERALAIGDVAGGIRIVDAGTGADRGALPPLSSPVRWLEFGASGTRLYAATDHWLHEFAIEDGALHAGRTRLLPLDVVPAALSSDGRVLGLRGLGTRELGVTEVELDAAREPPAAPLERDWPSVLGRHVAEDGTIAQVLP